MKTSFLQSFESYVLGVSKEPSPNSHAWKKVPRSRDDRFTFPFAPPKHYSGLSPVSIVESVPSSILNVLRYALHCKVPIISHSSPHVVYNLVTHYLFYSHASSLSSNVLISGVQYNSGVLAITIAPAEAGDCAPNRFTIRPQLGGMILILTIVCGEFCRQDRDTDRIVQQYQACVGRNPW